MFGIIVALKNEAMPVIELIENKKESVIAGKNVYEGEILGKNVVLILSGIGKVNAGMCAQILIDKFNVDKIINYGTVGGLMESVSVGSYYAVSKCCQYDFDLSDLDDVSVGYMQDYDCIYFTPSLVDDFLPVKTLATSDRFTCREKDIDTVKKLACDIFDMEGASVAQVCTSNAIPYYLIKGVVDVHGSTTHKEQFIKNLTSVCSGFGALISDFITKI